MTPASKTLMRLVGSTLLIGGFAGCAAADRRTSALKDAEVPGTGERAALLGYGYDTTKEQFRGTCVTGDLRYAGTPTATVKFDRGLTHDELMTELGLDVGGKASLAVFDIKGAVRLALDAAKTDHSESLTFTSEVRGKNALMTNGRLTDFGKAARDTADQAQIQERCGDDFVEQVELGAQLFLNVRFDFASADVKSDFEAEADLSVAGFFEVNGKMKAAAERYGDNVNISISAYQAGGSVEKLATILSPVSGEPESAVLRCSLKNLDACTKALDRLVAYAANDFPTQITNLTYDPDRPGGTAFVSYKTSSYYGHGFQDLYPHPAPVLAAEIEAKRQQILTLYQVQAKDRKRAETLQEFFRLTDAEKVVIDGVDGVLNRNIAKLVRVGQLCYDQPMQCVDAADKLWSGAAGEKLEEYNPAALIKTLTFVDYCSAPGQTDNVRKTVIALKTVASETDCEAAEAELKSFDSLDLSGQQLVDLKPLRGLERLQSVTLRNNLIANVEPLAALPNLRSVDLRTNHVNGIAALGTLTRLTRLDLAYNRIVDVSPLAGLTSLETLFLQGNQVADAAPVRALPKLRTLFVTEDEVCATERAWLKDNGKVTADDFTFYQTVNFAPAYVIEGQRNSGIEGWYLCSYVAHTLQ